MQGHGEWRGWDIGMASQGNRWWWSIARNSEPHLSYGGSALTKWGANRQMVRMRDRVERGLV